MKTDRYTKAVLTVIAGLLSVIAFNMARGPAPARAEPAEHAEATPFAHYQFSTYKDDSSNFRLLIVDNTTDKLYDCGYDWKARDATGESLHKLVTGN